MTADGTLQALSSAGEIADRRPDVVREFDAYKAAVVTEAVEATFNMYGESLTAARARALAWRWIDSAASRCDWQSVRIVLDAYTARFPGTK